MHAAATVAPSAALLWGTTSCSRSRRTPTGGAPSRDTALSAIPTVAIPSATVNVTAEPGKLQLYELDPASGREIEAIDDVAVLPGLQITLDVAEARVFLLGKAL